MFSNWRLLWLRWSWLPGSLWADIMSTPVAFDTSLLVPAASAGLQPSGPSSPESPVRQAFKKYRLAHRSASRDGRWAERDNAKRSYLSMSADNAFAAWAKIAIYKCHLGFYSKTSFRPSYCQISTDLYKILHTAIAVRNTLVSRPDRDRPQSKPQWLLVTLTP